MSITNYSELQTAVSATWPRRADLSAMAADFITLGEARLNRKLRIREMEEAATINPSTSVRYVSLPTGYLEVISLNSDLGDELQPLTSELLEKATYSASNSRPEYYRISSRIDFERIADQSYNFTLRYFKKLDIATDTTNTVLTNYPDLYLWAALVNAEMYVKNDARIAVWKSSLEEALKELNRQGKRNLNTLRVDTPTRGNFDIWSGR